MSHPAPTLNELADDIESLGNHLALLADLTVFDLSSRGRLGALQVASSMLNELGSIESNLQVLRTHHER